MWFYTIFFSDSVQARVWEAMQTEPAIGQSGVVARDGVLVRRQTD
jgi:hypothetical protein